MVDHEVLATAEPTYYSADMVRTLNAGERTGAERYECVYGELIVSPSPSELHQRIVARLLVKIANHLASHGTDLTVYVSPADITFGREDVLIQPDVFVLDRELARVADRARSWSVVTHLRLAIEVVSESSRRTDRFAKRSLYQHERVDAYWIVDPAARLIEVWTPDAAQPRIERERVTWHAEGAATPLVMLLEELFAAP